MKQTYIETRMSRDNLTLIETANSIIEEYQRQGYTLTLRQLYYQLVARDLIPNTESSYKRVGNTISKGRLAGLIDWEAIEDRTRNLMSYRTWRDPAAMLSYASAVYTINKWELQPNYVEVWVEKEALASVVARACANREVPHFSCRGYVSQSEMWRAGTRLQRQKEAGKDVYIIHLGDHDPSGIDMTRDIIDRLELFMGGAEVNRIALNYEQIMTYSPPPNPAKLTDSRVKDYIRKFGKQSWELDALEPSIINNLIDSSIESLIDPYLWDEAEELEDEGRATLLKYHQKETKKARR
jgi:hypothetical protein